LNEPAPRQESSLTRGLRLTAVVATALLFVLITRWVVVAPSVPRIVAGAILGLPLAIGAPLVYIGYRRACAWLTLALAPPLVLGLTEAVANLEMRRWATVLLLDLFVTFLLLVAYLRATRSS
jgi:hypothetical protein